MFAKKRLANQWQKNLSAIILPLVAVLMTPLVFAGSKDDPLLTKVLVDQLEIRDTQGDNPLVLEAQGWIGKDLQKLWLKTEVDNTNHTRMDSVQC